MCSLVLGNMSGKPPWRDSQTKVDEDGRRVEAKDCIHYMLVKKANCQRRDKVSLWMIVAQVATVVFRDFEQEVVL